MHTVELLEEALAVIRQLGYTVRSESLAGCGGGGCEYKGRKMFFLDLDLGPAEQLEQVLATLRRVPEAELGSMPVALRAMLDADESR